MDLTKTGVYSITNTVNSKQYIGSASGSFRSRRNRHYHDLRHNKHHSKPLQRAWNKYGEEAFKFEVLAICPPSFCLAGEQFYLDAWKPEYNICKVAGNTLGVKPTPEQREANRKRGLERMNRPEVREANRLRALKQFESKEAREENARKAKLHYELNPESREKARERGKKQFATKEAVEAQRQRAIKQFSSEEARQRQREKNCKFTYGIETPSGKIDYCISIKEYAKLNNLASSALAYTFYGKDKVGNPINYHKGYKIVSKTPRQK
jgi:group I intron endonuclease